MKRVLTILLLLGAVPLLVRCDRRPLVDPGNTHYVRVYLDEELKNVTTGFYDATLQHPDYTPPEALRVVLYDQTTGRLAAERYLRNRRQDARGWFYDGHIVAPPGRYRLLTYNFGTEATLLHAAESFSEAMAYTNPISDQLLSSLSRGEEEGERIVYTPDHLFADRHTELYLPAKMGTDTIRNASGDYFTGRSVVKSYYLQIRVQGIQWISSSVALLTGMSGSAMLHDGAMRDEDPVTLYFEMLRTDDRRRADEAVIYTTFNTFGKLPDRQNRLEITFDIVTTDGRKLTKTLDITEKFYTPEAIDHQWLLIDEVLNIPEPPESEGGGGFEPGVGEWEDIKTDIII